ncbi:GreA/GreB family elongation factor [Pedobacter flavus]|uniref:GreA/GreB family elongation factor n=1 Tax=Pedobacter flavus TaxID=3113906 RepID=A0ABU7H2V3_9SPHI|nr:GreA/GreB family elongation factor [Pedobacter sp. VNH31]MEE1885637.1 GreA/GreB family elongation factor [Pedobacter sp. VNH31]
MNKDLNTTQHSIVLSRGIFDLLKVHVNRKKLSKYNEDKLNLELRNAKQILAKDIPSDVVTVNKQVRLIDVETGEESVYKLVGDGVAKRKNGTLSILSPIGVAIVGYPVGAEVTWEMPTGIRTYKILEVENL